MFYISTKLAKYVKSEVFMNWGTWEVKHYALYIIAVMIRIAEFAVLLGAFYFITVGILCI